MQLIIVISKDESNERPKHADQINQEDKEEKRTINTNKFQNKETTLESLIVKAITEILMMRG